MIYKFQAAMLGYAIGDALAAPIEDVYRSPDQGYEPIEYYSKAFPSHPVSHLKPGQYSDETQIMLLVADSLIESNGFSIDNFAKHLVDWHYSQKKRSEWRFPGNTMVKSCRKLAVGTPWNQSGHLSAGIIASCRTVPYALVYRNNPAMLKVAIDKSCKITHTDQRTIGVALALASVIKIGLDNQDMDFDMVIRKIIEKTHIYIPDIVSRMNTVKMSLNKKPAIAIGNIGNSGFCLESFSSALYWFFTSHRDFDKMIIGAANGCGDADAIAAMAGSMFGAWYGLESIDDKWLRELENVQAIRQKACDLFRISSSVS